MVGFCPEMRDTFTAPTVPSSDGVVGVPVVLAAFCCSWGGCHRANDWLLLHLYGRGGGGLKRDFHLDAPVEETKLMELTLHYFCYDQVKETSSNREMLCPQFSIF